MNKFTFKLALVAVLLFCSMVFAAQYHQQDLFPLGFSGFSYTGYYFDEDNADKSPYPDDYSIGIWNQEDSLLQLTHCNFIGCSDAWQNSYINFWKWDSAKADFYNEVCLKTLNTPETIYVAVNGTRCPRYLDANHDGDLNDPDSGDVNDPSPSPIGWKPVFVNNWPYGSSGDGQPDVFWDSMTVHDTIAAATCYDKYFDKHHPDVNPHCFWGYNCFVENPGMYDVHKSGIEKADDSITTYIRARETTGSNGLYGSHRMIIAKGQIYHFYEDGMEVNLFAKVPEIDAILKYTYMIAAYMPYGSQPYFDSLLYGEAYAKEPNKGQVKPMAGVHNTAIYMQKNGNWDLQDNQDRRWMAGVEINWEFMWRDQDIERVLSRRPCPPEIRAICYLSLSRGAKGLLFVNYYNHKNRSHKIGDSTVTTIPNAFPDSADMPIVDTNHDYKGRHSLRTGCLGLRDYTSKPCDSTEVNARLLTVHSSGPYHTVWDGAKDHTFGYICELIPEIKAISDVLMQLEWDSAFSIRSTDTNWAKPCPHGYVDSVTTTDSGYIDLGFFSPYYWQDYGKYLMVVNRDGIRDNQPASITLYLDFPDKDSLHVVEYGDPDTSYFLTKAGDGYFHLTRDYAPGEGKLFRIEEYV